MPAFASLMRPGDLGRDVLDRAGFRLPFSEQYRALSNAEVLPENLRNDANLFGFEWYDNIWGMLMMNSVMVVVSRDRRGDFSVPDAGGILCQSQRRSVLCYFA